MSLAIATPVAAQPFDHLKCYKVKDPHKFEATADLVPRDDPPFAVEPGCRVKVTGKKLCVPVDKQLLATTAPVVEFPTAEASSDYLCYKVKCPKGAVPDLEVTDQFGTRTVSGLRAKEICTPAVKGPTAVYVHGPDFADVRPGELSGGSGMRHFGACLRLRADPLIRAS
jgi:hypothetical protein